MTKNVGIVDRWLRGVSAAGLLSCAALAPLPLGVRLVGFALPGAYVFLTAITGRCLGYRLLGRSTCAVARGR